MPTFEYRCQHCEKEFTFQASITAPPETKCPICETPSLRRLISKTSFALKGGGWTPKFGAR